MRQKLAELFGIDLRALAALRVVLGALALVDLALRARDLTAFYTERGVLPEALAARLAPPGAWSLHFAASSTEAALVFALHAAAAAALLVGHRTRVAAAVTWLLFVSLHHRNVATEQGADEVLRLVLFWSLWLPLGTRFGLDARKAPTPPAGERVTSIAGAALMLQIAAIYWIGFLHKQSEVWATGDAAWLALSHDHVGRAWAQRLLLPHPELVRLLGRAVLWLELLAPTLLFVPFRTERFRVAGVVGIVALQLGFGAMLHVAHFPWVSALVMVVFLPRSAFDALERLVRRASSPLATRADVSPTSPSIRAPSAWARDALIAALLVYVTAWVVVGLRRDGDTPLRRGSLPGTVLGLDQRWTMFAPPAIDSGWFVFAGELADETQLDVFPSLREAGLSQPVTWDKPADVFGTFRNTRWLDYLGILGEEDDAALWSGVGDWVCSRWNETHADGQRLERFSITYVLEETAPPGTPRTRTTWNRLYQACAK